MIILALQYTGMALVVITNLLLALTPRYLSAILITGAISSLLMVIYGIGTAQYGIAIGQIILGLLNLGGLLRHKIYGESDKV